MPSLLPTRWTVPAPTSVRIDPVLVDDDDFAIGCEAAFPALQLEGWGVPPDAARVQEPSFN